MIYSMVPSTVTLSDP